MTIITQKALSGIADTALLVDLDEASNEFAAWQAHEATSTAALYKVMERAMAIAKTYDISILKVAAKANDIKTQKNSTVFGIAAKLVFRGIDNAKASAYATVMEKANTAGIAPAALSAWIVSEGGLEKIRTGGSTTTNEAKKAADLAHVSKALNVINGRYSTPLTLPAPNPAAAKIKTTGRTPTAALLVKINDAGDIDVLFSYTDSDVLETLYRKMGEAMESPVSPAFSQVFASEPAPLHDEQEDAIDAAVEASK
ncbi:Hypothetical protein NGAL_HAMBI490_59640 [Neorhizobium galegae bv. officinalis]|nr:Hypothetical protein NGAL_HAMBI490_59640 [Neorhizobium galegae bv. officinalis]